jgi:leucyl aminopeptidase
LGLKTAGIFSNDDLLCENLCLAGKSAGESFWRLPILAELKESLKSPMADIKNCGDRYGGSITAALFLQEFIMPSVKWAHLDIAGPATTHKVHAYNTVGGVGFGIRTLIEYIMGQK